MPFHTSSLFVLSLSDLSGKHQTSETKQLAHYLQQEEEAVEVTTNFPAC